MKTAKGTDNISQLDISPEVQPASPSDAWAPLLASTLNALQQEPPLGFSFSASRNHRHLTFNILQVDFHFLSYKL